MKKILIVLMMVILPVLCFAQKSNPDGIIGRPSLTLLGGYGLGDIHKNINSNSLPLADLKTYGFRIEMIYPIDKETSFIFQLHYDKQNEKLSETYDIWKNELNLTGYGLVVGIRLFGSW